MRSLLLSSVMALAACSSVPPEIVYQAPPAPMPRPAPPAGAAVGLILPPMAADGRHMTPNRDLTSNETVWHLRMALNVAALVCTKDSSPRLQYNQFLSIHKAELAKVNASVDVEYRGRFGAEAINIRDKRNTMVYNFFAQPPAHSGFCAAATAIGATADAMPSAQLAAFAPTALAALEQPFLDFYRAYADYQQRLAAWSNGTVPPAAPQMTRLELDLPEDVAMSDATVTQDSTPYPRLARSR